MELQLQVCEKEVGPFRADILCKDINSERWESIKNSTRKNGSQTSWSSSDICIRVKTLTIIWVAGTFTKEHRAVLDWVNEMTDDRLHFFGSEIELWQVGDFLPAPKFNIIAKPNNWSQRVAVAANKISEENLSETKKLTAGILARVV